MKLLAVVAGLAGALAGAVATQALMTIPSSDIQFPPPSLDEAQGLIALGLCVLGAAGALLSLAGSLAGFLLLAAGGGFWYFLPDYAIPAVPLFFVAAVAAILAR